MNIRNLAMDSTKSSLSKTTKHNVKDPDNAIKSHNFDKCHHMTFFVLKDIHYALPHNDR